jgi:hypothetical protein
LYYSCAALMQRRAGFTRPFFVHVLSCRTLTRYTKMVTRIDEDDSLFPCLTDCRRSHAGFGPRPFTNVSIANGGTLISNTRVDKNCKAGRQVVRNPPCRHHLHPEPSPLALLPTRRLQVFRGCKKIRRRRVIPIVGIFSIRNWPVNSATLNRRKDLGEQEALRGSPERMAPYRDRVAQHERNIQAIQKELKQFALVISRKSLVVSEVRGRQRRPLFLLTATD